MFIQIYFHTGAQFFLFRWPTFINWCTTRINRQIPFADDINGQTNQNTDNWFALKTSKNWFSGKSWMFFIRQRNWFLLIGVTKLKPGAFDWWRKTKSREKGFFLK